MRFGYLKPIFLLSFPLTSEGTFRLTLGHVRQKRFLDGNPMYSKIRNFLLYNMIHIELKFVV